MERIFSNPEASIGVVFSGKNEKLPYFEEGGKFVVLDGELENSPSLSREIGSSQEHQNDAEIVFRLYEKFPADFEKRLRGRYCFSIWDGKNLVIGRDKLGLKFLTYSVLGSDFVFSSEAKSLLNYEKVKREVNVSALIESSVLYSTFNSSTFFLGINQLEPGETLRISRKRMAKSHSDYFSDVPKESLTEESAVKKLREILLKDMEGLMRDGSYKLFPLSGGVDSTIIVSIASGISSKLNTITVSDDEKNPDVRYSRMVSEHLGTDHKEIIVDFENFVSCMPKTVWLIETPRNAISLPVYMGRIGRNKTIKMFNGSGSETVFEPYSIHQLDAFKKRILGRLLEFGGSQKAIPIKEHIDKIFSGEGEQRMDNYFFHNLRGGVLTSIVQFQEKGTPGIENVYPYLGDDIVSFLHSVPNPIRFDPKASKHLLKEASGLMKTPLKFVFEREKFRFDHNFKNSECMLEKKADSLISDERYRRHPYKKFLKTKGEVVRFDLFKRIFIENEGEFDKKLTIYDLY